MKNEVYPHIYVFTASTDRKVLLTARPLLLLCLFLFVYSINFAATRTSTAAGGNWSAGGTWVGGVAPAATDDVVIATTGGNTVTVNTGATRTCAGVVINTGARLTLAILLTVNGPWTNNGTFTSSTFAVAFGGASASIEAGSGSGNFNTITINSGTTMTIDGTATTATLTYAAVAATTRVSLGSTGSLTVTGTMSMPRPNAGTTATMAVGDGTLSVGALTMSATTSTRNDSLTINDGTCTITGTPTMGTTGCIVRFYGDGLLTIGGVLSGGPPTLSCPSGTIEYSRAGVQTMWAGTYFNLTLSGSGNKTVSTGTTINGTMSMQGTAAAITNTPIYGTNSALEYKGTAEQITTNIEFPNTGVGTGGLIINNANGVRLNAAKNMGADPITIGSTVPNSILKDSSFTITCTGAVNCISGTFRLGSSTVATTYPNFSSSTYGAGSVVQYASGVAQTVSTTPSYQNLVFSGNGAKTTATGTLTIAENWTLMGGAATMSTNNTSASVAGDILGTATMTLGSGTISITGDFSHTGTFTAGTSTVNYNNASGGQVVKSATYNTVAMLNTSGTQSAAGAITASTINTTAGGTLNMGVFTLAATNVNHSGILLTQNTSATPISTGKTWGGTVSFNSASPQTIVIGNYHDLDGTGGNRTLSTAGTIGIAGAFTPGAGSYTVLNSTVNFNGSGNQNIPNFTFHDLIVSNAGIKKIPGSIVVACQTIDITGTASVEIDADNAGRLNVLE
jgi:hypothetical protein